jgi:hypothetical protein
MLVWLYIANKYSSNNCASQLKIFIYHTTLLKILPNTNIEILDENNVNTAFTRTCPINSEIVVFRKEEWFKVFIHETFHNFGLDFSGMNLMSCNKTILKLFPVNSKVNLFESYAEFWARIMNALFCGYVNIKDKNNVNDFLKNVEVFIRLECMFSFFQMVKVLNFMGLNYHTLYDKSHTATKLRNTLYKEDTNVLSYYVITLILMNNYNEFLTWCNIHNTSILQFKKTNKNVLEYCNFIKEKHETKNMLENVKCAENIYNKFNNKFNNKTYKKDSKRNNVDIYFLTNLRMTICELE